MEEIEDIILLLNPWWKMAGISKELAKLYRRMAFNKVKKLLNYKQMVILSGLRRVGKTTIFYQLIEDLFKEINSKQIFYFNFDKKVLDLIEILDKYQKLTGVEWKKEKIFVFLDEVSKLEDWANKIKLLYDAFPNIKFLVSSSGSLSLEEEAIRNLGGRYFLVDIKPLNFVEYLELTKNEKLLENFSLWEDEIKKELDNYLLRGFPEIIGWKDNLLVKDYLRTTIIDKIIRYDLPEKFRNINKDLLLNLLNIFYSEPGIYLDYDSLSKSLGISKKTLAKHIFYLEFTYLIRRIKNFRVGVLTSSRKLQRIYANWWTLAYCYTDNYDKLMENVVASYLDAKFYWRKDNKEIDFIILREKNILPIEIKNKEELSNKDLKNMEYFLNKNKIKEGLVVYNGKEKEIIIKNKKIKLVPLWKFLLTNSSFE